MYILWDENNCRHAGACLKSLPMHSVHDKNTTDVMFVDFLLCTKPDVFKVEDG